MIRRLFTIGGVACAALAVVTATSPIARADTDAVNTAPLSDVIIFVGHATITSDAGPGEPDSPAAVDLMGGSGSFSFNNVANGCVGWSDPSEAGLCAITSSGTFTNTVCGTGDVPAGTTATVSSGFDNGTATYGITFAAGIGIIKGGSTFSEADGTDNIAGVIVLGPPVPQLLDSGDCVAGFTPIGVIVGLGG